MRCYMAGTFFVLDRGPGPPREAENWESEPSSQRGVSERVGFNSTPTQFRPLAPSLARKAGTESPTVKGSRRYRNLANAI